MALNGEEARLVAALRCAGLRLTPQRQAIARALADDGTHPTAQELHARLLPRFGSMSIATIYNTLAAITKLGVCRELDMGGATRFDSHVTPHDHAVCERCGDIRDVVASVGGAGRVSPAGPQLSPPEESPLPGFRVERVERVYRGVCAQCTDAA